MADQNTTSSSGSSQSGSSFGAAAQTAKTKVADTASTVKEKAANLGQQAADTIDGNRDTAADKMESAAANGSPESR